MSTAFVITSQNTLTFRCGQVQRLAIHLAAELSLNNCPCYQKKRYTICTYLSPSDPDKLEALVYFDSISDEIKPGSSNYYMRPQSSYFPLFTTFNSNLWIKRKFMRKYPILYAFSDGITRSSLALGKTVLLRVQPPLDKTN